MKGTVKRQSSGAEFFTSELCYITELLNTANDAELSIARARVEPGITTRWHQLKDTTERYYILRGRGSVEVGELPAQDVAPGDLVLIPPMCPQRISNTGKDDLVFLAICTPRFTTEVYQDIDDEKG